MFFSFWPSSGLTLIWESSRGHYLRAPGSKSQGMFTPRASITRPGSPDLDPGPSPDPSLSWASRPTGPITSFGSDPAYAGALALCGPSWADGPDRGPFLTGLEVGHAEATGGAPSRGWGVPGAPSGWSCSGRQAQGA